MTALVAAGVLLAVWRWWVGPQVVVEVIQRRDLVQSVVASGRVESPHRVEIGSQVTGTVMRIPVAEGQRVAAGDVLIELEPAESLAALSQAEVAVLLAATRLRQLDEVQLPVAEQALRQAEISRHNAQTMLQRQQDLFDRGFIGEAALDDSRKAFELADAQSRSARKQLDTLRPSGSDRVLASAAVAQARAAEQAARARATYAVIRAPRAGTLIGRSVEVGDVVQAGKPLMTLSPAGPTQLVAEIDERNLRLLALGQQALASADAYPLQRFAAQVDYINPAVNAQTGSVEIKLGVPEPPKVLTQDMTVSVDIEIARRPAALALPLGALQEADPPEEAAGTVLRLEQGRAVRQPVSLGLRSGGWVELLGGLHEGDRVISMPAAVSPGARVRGVEQSRRP